MKIGITIHYSTLDQEYIEEVINSALAITKHINVICFSALFDGTPEKKDLIDAVVAKFPNVEFYELPYIDGESAWVHHSQARLKGYTLLCDQVDYILYLDSDEVIDINFKEWLQYGLRYNAYKIANYVYFKSRDYRALAIEDSAVLRKVSATVPELFSVNIEQDRDQLAYDAMRTCTLRGKPLIHHYSWAKSMDSLTQKVKTWGHKNDRDWQAILQQIETFNVKTDKDPVWGYTYIQLNK